MAPTYLDLAKEAIINLKERNGSSQAAIKKYIETNHPEVAFAQQHLRSALQRGVETGKLVKVKASFKLSAASRALELAKAKREAKAKKTPASGKDKDTKRPEDVARLTSELYTAVRAGDEVAVRDLISRGADVNSTSECATPLHTAVRYPNIIAVLLDHGANPNVGDEFNETTPLQLLAGFARLQNEIDSINLLIERGADLEFKDAHGQTAMHYAAGNHPGTVATMLLEKGACINAKDNVGHTPFYKALECKGRTPRHAVAELLQEKGAEI